MIPAPSIPVQFARPIPSVSSGEEATLKYLRREDGRVRLDPANAAYEPQIYDPREVVVQGKLAGLLRRYH